MIPPPRNCGHCGLNRQRKFVWGGEERDKMGERWKAHVGMAMVMVNYGGYHVITKLALSVGLTQIVFCAYREMIALCILTPYAYFKEKGSRPPLNRSLLLSFMFLGLTGIYGCQLLFILGLSLTSPAVAAALQPSIPVFTSVLAVIIGTEKLNFKRRDGKVKIVGFLVSVSGAFLLAVYKGPAIFGDGYDIDNILRAMGGKPSPEPVWWLGSALVFMGLDMWHIGILCLVGNCICLAIYLAYQAPVLVKYPHSLSITAYSYFFGAVFIGVTCLLTKPNISAFSLTGAEIYGVIYAGLVASAINYMIMSYSNKVLGPSLVALYMPLQPVTTAVLSRIFLGSSVFLGNILGAILILIGLFCVTWAGSESSRLENRQVPLTEALIGESSAISARVPLLKVLGQRVSSHRSSSPNSLTSERSADPLEIVYRESPRFNETSA